MPMPRNGSAKEFARLLRMYREQKGWSRQELASRMEVTPAAVGNWETAKNFPEIGSRDLLCQILGVSAEELHLPPYNADD